MDTRQPEVRDAVTNDTKYEVKGTGKILALIKNVLYHGFPVLGTFAAGLNVTGTTTITGNETVSGTLGITGATTTGAITATQPATGTTTAKVVGIAGSTVNLLEVDASAVTNAQKIVVDKNGHLAISQAAVPTGVLGTGAGTGAGTAPVLTITGTDQSGTIQIVTGTQVPVAGATLVTMTFKTAMAVAPTAVGIWPHNGATAALARNQDAWTASGTYSATQWNAFSGTVALAISTTYIWHYRVN